jgi:hypothetical protein
MGNQNHGAAQTHQPALTQTPRNAAAARVIHSNNVLGIQHQSPPRQTPINHRQVSRTSIHPTRHACKHHQRCVHPAEETITCSLQGRVRPRYYFNLTSVTGTTVHTLGLPLETGLALACHQRTIEEAWDRFTFSNHMAFMSNQL